MAYPTNPNNGDIYIKGSTPYIYASANKSWTQTTDANLVAGNIKNSVSILGVTGTFPNDGNAGVGDVLSGKTFYTTNATKHTGTYTPTSFGDYLISAGELPILYGNTGTSFNQTTSYCLNSGNYIYCPVAIRANGALDICMMVIATDNSALPLVVNAPGVLTDNGSIVSVYINSGVIYFNLTDVYNGQYHCYYTISNNTWTTSLVGGYYTTGTLINSILQLNGFKYEAAVVRFDGGTDSFFFPLCQVTII